MFVVWSEKNRADKAHPYSNRFEQIQLSSNTLMIAWLAGVFLIEIPILNLDFDLVNCILSSYFDFISIFRPYRKYWIQNHIFSNGIK